MIFQAQFGQLMQVIEVITLRVSILPSRLHLLGVSENDQRVYDHDNHVYKLGTREKSIIDNNILHNPRSNWNQYARDICLHQPAIENKGNNVQCNQQSYREENRN